MENLKNVAPIEDFNWDAYENGEAVTNASHEDLEKAYDGTLNKVNDREVVDGTVIAMNKREVVGGQSEIERRQTDRTVCRDLFHSHRSGVSESRFCRDLYLNVLQRGRRCILNRKLMND